MFGKAELQDASTLADHHVRAGDTVQLMLTSKASSGPRAAEPEHESGAAAHMNGISVGDVVEPRACAAPALVGTATTASSSTRCLVLNCPDISGSKRTVHEGT